MMNNILMREKSEIISTNRLFCDSLIIKFSASDQAIAIRSPEIGCDFTDYNKNPELVSESSQYAIYKNDEQVFCRILTHPSIDALILPVNRDFSSERTIKLIENTIGRINTIDLHSKERFKTYENIEDIVYKISSYCGCKTDISRSNNDDLARLEVANESQTPNNLLIGVLLTVISLMFRRISALRGFNFRLTYIDGLPCLVFSADIILSHNEDSFEAVPEYRALMELLKATDPILVSKKLAPKGEYEETGSEHMSRLAMAICPQTCDPRGILHAGEWNNYAKQLIEKVDVDIPGRF